MVTKVRPHRIVKERSLFATDYTKVTRRHCPRHHRMETLGANDTCFEGIHIQIADDNSAGMTGIVLGVSYVGTYPCAVLYLIVVAPIQFTRQVGVPSSQ